MVPFLAAIVALTNACGTVSVDTHGARVVSYVPVGGEEMLFVSKTGTGGIPLCWPWFAGLGPEGSQRHGIARYRDFKVVGNKYHSYCDRELILRLESDAETRQIFPHDFALTVSVRLNDRLTLKMIGENTGSTPFEVTEAFHPYLAVSDSPQCREEGEMSGEWRMHDPVLGRTFSFTDEAGAAAVCGVRTPKAIFRRRFRRSNPASGGSSSARRTARWRRRGPISSSPARRTRSCARSVSSPRTTTRS